MIARTVPERVIHSTSSPDKRVSLAAATVFAGLALRSRSLLLGAAALVVGATAFRKRATLQTLESTSAIRVSDFQRTVTIRASLAEVEMYLLGEPPPLEIAFTLTPRAYETEVQGRVPPRASDADEVLRSYLRRMKQMIEAGEIAAVDEAVHG